MTERKRHSDSQWRRLEARMTQAKRSQADVRLNRAIFWALMLGALMIVAIQLLVHYTS